MIVRVDADGRVRLLEAADLRRFSIAMPNTDNARDALGGIARLDGRNHAWIAPDSIRALAAPVKPEWADQFTAMTAYAAAKGWTDSAGSLRAHIDYD